MSKIKNGGLDQYGTEPVEWQQFETAGVEGVNDSFTMCNYMNWLPPTSVAVNRFRVYNYWITIMRWRPTALSIQQRRNFGLKSEGPNFYPNEYTYWNTGYILTYFTTHVLSWWQTNDKINRFCRPILSDDKNRPTFVCHTTDFIARFYRPIFRR